MLLGSGRSQGGRGGESAEAGTRKENGAERKRLRLKALPPTGGTHTC